jgi:regulatory protein
LQRLGYINDEKFALEWALTRAKHRGFGKRKIEQELKQKGIGLDHIKKASREVITAELELSSALHAAEKKLHSMKTLSREICRRRLAAFLERKGYSYDTLREVLKQHMSEHPRIYGDEQR